MCLRNRYCQSYILRGIGNIVSRVATGARWTVRGLAELLVTAGVLVLLFAVYLVFWSDVRTAAAQHDLRATFEHQTQQVAAAAEDRPAPGQAGAGEGRRESHSGGVPARCRHRRDAHPTPRTGLGVDRRRGRRARGPRQGTRPLPGHRRTRRDRQLRGRRAPRHQRRAVRLPRHGRARRPRHRPDPDRLVGLHGDPQSPGRPRPRSTSSPPCPANRAPSPTRRSSPWSPVTPAGDRASASSSTDC